MDMNNIPSTSKQNVSVFEDDDIFEDSSILANFNNSSFNETASRVDKSKPNVFHNKSDLNVSALCCDEELSGYDKLTGRTWIYPTNYPVRDYQFNIINAAILNNTLVSLPTGLGKTFIAAVIMYNFYRWYPLGKIVFTAPTRPLVAQQIGACYNVVAMPPSDTVEMTGHMQVNTRKAHWQSKRVFFATPQVIYNDIKSGICPGDKIRCLVIDEAHRAKGNYAYCQIVGTLTDMGHKLYRVLALSATPGSKVDDVVNVVRNLHISHLELRTESCADVAPYSHTRSINTVIVPLGPELSHLKQEFIEIVDGYARNLKDLHILPHNVGNLSKGRVVMLYKEFQSKDRAARHKNHNYIMKDFMALIALFHGLELLIKHGSRVFLNFFDEHPEKIWIQNDNKLTMLLERLRDDLGVNPLSLNRSILPDGTIPELPSNLVFGHPKFYKLKEIMMEHFSQAMKKGQDTRAIVFCEYRESVNLVHCLLLQCRPLITPQMFVGQGASGKDGKTVVSQKQQLRVMRNFREGACNTLVATCVAEEGLDVGSVDLILCFDISTRSPVRLVQRCGRTGRERGGQVYILVTEGREHQTLIDCMRQRDGLNRKIMQSPDVQSSLYALNPRLLPRDLTPQCQKMYITVPKKDQSGGDGGEKCNKKNQKDLRTMLLGRASSSSSSSNSKDAEGSRVITEQEFREIFPEGFQSTILFGEPKEFLALNNATIKALSKMDKPHLNLSTWLEWQRTLQKTVNIGHSMDTEILSSLLQYSDAKRFEMPVSTQNPSFNTQDCATQNILMSSPAKKPPLAKTPTKKSPSKPIQPKKKQNINKLTKSPGRKDGDIRALFSTATKSTKNYTKLISDLGIQNDGSIPTRLISLLVDLSVDNTITRECHVCRSICDCSIIINMRNNKKPAQPKFLIDPKFPDIDLIDDFRAETILKCAKNISGNESFINQDVKDEADIDLDVDNKNNCSKNFDLEFDFDSPVDLTSPDNKLNEENINNIEEKNFDIGDIEDIFNVGSPDEAIAVESKDKLSSNPEQALGFFGLDSIDDIFADSDDSIDNKYSTTASKPVKNNDGNQINVNEIISNVDRPGSPSILSGRPKTIICTSPILCSQFRKGKLSTKKTPLQSSTPVSNVRKQLISEPIRNNNTISKEQTKSKIENSLANTSNKSMFTITQLVDIINKTDNNKSALLKSNTTGDVDISVIKENNKSTSPILLTQAERNVNHSSKNNLSTTKNKKIDSLIILESDSDSDENQGYDKDKKIDEFGCSNLDFTETFLTPPEQNKCIAQTPDIGNEPFKSPISNKRKLEMDDNEVIVNSPHFSKKQKLNNNTVKPLTLQEKVLAALSSNKMNKDPFENNIDINFVLSPQIISQKENENPLFCNTNPPISDYKKEYVRKSNLEMFRRDSKVASPKKKSFLNSPKNHHIPRKSKITFEDSDDDFVGGESNHHREKLMTNGQRMKATTNHKVRKKKPKHNGFLDLEAEQSDDETASGDELSDDSIGSIVDFICDENLTQPDDMQAHYIRSIQNQAVNGAFKIPQLPKKYNADVFSQYVEEDSYEMDSFCVDSHIGLTQANGNMSELELAEIILEKQKAKKKSRARPQPYLRQENDGSPLVRRTNKNVKRQIHSDSDDSS